MNHRTLVLVAVLVVSFLVLTYLLGLGGFLAAVFGNIALFVLTNPDRAVSYLASAYKRGRGISFWFERNAVEKRLESSISLASRRANEEGVNILPHGVDIRWVESKERDAFLKEGKIVVCLEPSVNEARNLARATMLYTSEDLIRESQRFIDEEIMKALCLSVSKKLLMLDGRTDAIRCLREEYTLPEITAHPSVGNYIETIENLDSDGYQTRILLRELLELEIKVTSPGAERRSTKETVSFMDVMKKFSEKQRGVDINPTHRGRFIDMTIMLVAREGVTSPEPYIRYAKLSWERGVPRIYALAGGSNIAIAKATTAAANTRGLYRTETTWEYSLPTKVGLARTYLAVLSRFQA